MHIVADRAALLSRTADPDEDLATLMRRLPVDQRVRLDGSDAELVRIAAPARLRCRGGKIVITDSAGRIVDAATGKDSTLIRALRSAHALMARAGGLAGRPETSAINAAPANPYERNLIKLAFLAPEIQARILDGRQPLGLTLEALISANLPAAWADQLVWAESLA